MAGTLSKSGYAVYRGVSPARVSQWLKEGRLTTAALRGSGRSAAIIVDKADKELARADARRTLDALTKRALRAVFA